MTKTTIHKKTVPEVLAAPTLRSHAEEAADSARALPEFRKFSLPGLRAQVSEMLRLIGTVEGIFSTYSKHDISHIDVMLRSLDWLIPDRTQKAMTPVDWLLTVVAIYLHDLGMVVTTEEFQRREENESFVSWRDSLSKTTPGREYIARTRRMSDEERARFYFQEFIRKGHASRIKEWITGRHTRRWGSKVAPIADAIAHALKSLPPRFLEHLAIVCESHHSNKLDKRNLFPLFTRVGNDPNEVVNVQYAAILLRTTDLLHVTQDRTPSVAYEIIRLTDPKGVEEWDKQLATFAVGPKSREFVDDDISTHVIQIYADFKEERPFFSLQEYIAYANKELEQVFRWAESSQQEGDGQNFWFPWRQLDGDVRLEGIAPQELRFEMDRDRLLQLLVGHTLYNDSTVAVRELLQNAIDAVRFQHFLDERSVASTGHDVPAMGRVSVCWNPETSELTIEDDGIGMDRQTIEYHLMRVGSSYYDTDSFREQNRGFTPISRFGIGILTSFMISDDIEIVTRRGESAHRIRMTSVESKYLLREIQPDDPMLEGLGTHGTRVKIVLRDRKALEERSVEDIVRYWVILPECRVEYRQEGMESKRIGFESITEALTEYSRPRSSETDDRSIPKDAVLDIVVEETFDEESDSRGTYELAFAVQTWLMPERTFASAAQRDAPRVCLEGIRVDNRLPGFGSGSLRSRGLNALLSVRNVRSLRTTASRYNLERDSEYDRLSSICARLLFRHVRGEVERIASSPGAPLSRASTAGYFLAQELSAEASSKTARNTLQTELGGLTHIVVEVSSDKPEEKSERYSVSPLELQELPVIWTVESRLVDSISLISRDLGKELSLHEFLRNLAPEMEQLKLSPLLPDARLHLGLLRRSHSLARVEFSKSSQQTAMRWEKSSSATTDYRLFSSVMELANYAVIEREAEKLLLQPRIGARLRYRSVPDVLIPLAQIDVTAIKGDLEDVQIVQHRNGLILASGSAPAEAFDALRSLWRKLLSDTQDPAKFALCFCLLYSFWHAVGSRSGEGDPDRTNRHDALRWWRELSKDGRELMNSSNVEGDLPPELPNLSKSADICFNASNFWRDWFRTE